ncbi:MAG: DEAD/DEAH box helicase [Desulfobulbaceae bacterium]|nr:DEAD/DEAH box helicase [Desulfobulbaceae bacterium]
MNHESEPLILTVNAQCQLVGAPDVLLKVLKNALTLPNPKYQSAQKYGRWIGKKLPQYLYFFTENKKGLLMPRGFAREVVLQCLDILGRKPEIIDQRLVLPERVFPFYGQLRDYQEEAVQAVLNRDFGVLEAGTGSGKTVMALKVIASRQQPTIILVHTKELMYQWVARIGDFLHVEAGVVGDGKSEVKPITVAIVNSARNQLASLSKHFGHVVVDECHRVPASLFTDVVTGFAAKYSLGLSATAYRRENVLTRLIYLYMGSRSHLVDAKRLQENGSILKPTFKLRPTGFSYHYRDDYPAMMTALTLDDARNRQIVDDVVAMAKQDNGAILVVSDRVAHCETLASLLNERGEQAAILTGRVSAEKRSEIVEGIKSNTVKILISTLQLIGEGFDAPGLTTLFLATPIKFSGRLKQVVGRILRPGEGKHATVYDYVDDQVGVLKHSASERQLTYLQLR